MQIGKYSFGIGARFAHQGEKRNIYRGARKFTKYSFSVARVIAVYSQRRYSTFSISSFSQPWSRNTHCHCPP